MANQLLRANAPRTPNWLLQLISLEAVKKYQVYVNPYDQCAVDRLTIIKFHRFSISDRELMRFVPSLSPFATKLEAYLRFFGINCKTVLEPTSMLKTSSSCAGYT